MFWVCDGFITQEPISIIANQGMDFLLQGAFGITYSAQEIDEIVNAIISSIEEDKKLTNKQKDKLKKTIEHFADDIRTKRKEIVLAKIKKLMEQVGAEDPAFRIAKTIERINILLAEAQYSIDNYSANLRYYSGKKELQKVRDKFRELIEKAKIARSNKAEEIRAIYETEKGERGRKLQLYG